MGDETGGGMDEYDAVVGSEGVRVGGEGEEDLVNNAMQKPCDCKPGEKCRVCTDFLEHIRDEIQLWALMDKPISLEDYQSLRLNSWEFEFILQRLDDRALAHVINHTLENCTHNRTNTSRPCVTYDEVLQLVMVPLLLRRLSGVKP